MRTFLCFLAMLPFVAADKRVAPPRAVEGFSVHGSLVHEDGAPLVQAASDVFARGVGPDGPVLGRGIVFARCRFRVVAESLAAGQPFDLVVEHPAYPTQVLRIDAWTPDGPRVDLGELRLRGPLPRVELEAVDEHGEAVAILDAIVCFAGSRGSAGRIHEGIHVHFGGQTPYRSERDATGRVFVTKTASARSWYVRSEGRPPALILIEPATPELARVDFAPPGWLGVEVPRWVSELGERLDLVACPPRGAGERARPEIASGLAQGRVFFDNVEPGVEYEIVLEHGLVLGYRAVLGKLWSGATDDVLVQPLRAQVTWHEFAAASSTGAAIDATFELPDSPSPAVHGPRKRLAVMTLPKEVRVRAPGHRTAIVPVEGSVTEVVLEPAPLARLELRGLGAPADVRFTLEAYAPGIHPGAAPQEITLDAEGRAQFAVTEDGRWEFVVRALDEFAARGAAADVALFADVSAGGPDVVLELPLAFAR